MAGLSQPPHGDMPRSGDHVQSVPKWPLALTLVQVTEFSPEVCKIAAPPAVEGLARWGRSATRTAAKVPVTVPGTPPSVCRAAASPAGRPAGGDGFQGGAGAGDALDMLLSRR
jgi:hypothetical protein